MAGINYSAIYFFIVLVCTCTFIQVQGATINDTETLLSNLLTSYNRRVRPINDQSQAIPIQVIMYVKSIQEFDEVQEKFSFVGAMSVIWNDNKMQWDPNQYGGLMNTTVGYNDIWVPELVLSSPSGKGTSVGKSTDVIRISADGTVYWFPSDLIQSTCSVSVRYYPFDTQKCTTTFASLGYKKYEVLLTNGQKTIDFSVFSQNALWKIAGSETTTLFLGGGDEMEISFTVHLRRKSAYVVINLLIPILVLSLMNAWVFILVPESGERIGYTITTLLAIAVYMTIVSDTLPQSSEPVPLISYKLMMDLVTSALIVFVTILNTRIHIRDDDLPVPKWLQRLYNTLQCVCCCCKTERITPVEECDDHFISMDKMKHPEKGEIKHPDRTDFDKDAKTHRDILVTWKSISYMVDWIALIGFSTFSVLSFVLFVGIAASSVK